jgi:hypothetical protein
MGEVARDNIFVEIVDWGVGGSGSIVSAVKISPDDRNHRDKTSGAWDA